jgi:hypothetical protein
VAAVAAAHATSVRSQLGVELVVTSNLGTGRTDGLQKEILRKGNRQKCRLVKITVLLIDLYPITPLGTRHNVFELNTILRRTALY